GSADSRDRPVRKATLTVATQIENSAYTGPSFSLRNRLARAAWDIVYALFFRTSPRPFHLWRRALLVLFGARIAKGCHIYPKARIWAPWNLVCDAESGVADGAI